MRLSQCAVAAILLGALVPASTSASTLAEASISGRDFSGDWKNFTSVGKGVTSIRGSWYGTNDYDFLALEGLASGAQTVTLTFSPKPPLVDSYSGGGVVQWSTSAPLYSAWGDTALGSIDFVAGRFDPITLVLKLGETFAGKLYLSLLGTNAYPVGYTISLSGNSSTEPSSSAASEVPLPAARTAPRRCNRDSGRARRMASFQATGLIRQTDPAENRTRIDADLPARQ